MTKGGGGDVWLTTGKVNSSRFLECFVVNLTLLSISAIYLLSLFFSRYGSTIWYYVPLLGGGGAPLQLPYYVSCLKGATLLVR